MSGMIFLLIVLLFVASCGFWVLVILRAIVRFLFDRPASVLAPAPQPPSYNDDAAMREGWAVFECDDGALRIQRLDSPEAGGPVFISDAAARAFVVERASKGSAMHQDALRLTSRIMRARRVTS